METVSFWPVIEKSTPKKNLFNRVACEVKQNLRMNLIVDCFISSKLSYMFSGEIRDVVE